jgi:hypothetical protein
MLDSRKNSPFVTPTPSMSVVPAITVMADCLKMGIFNQCLGMLIAAIANPHHVTTRQAIARGQRDSRFDMLVMLSFGVVYCLAAAVMCRSVAGRVFADEQRFADAAIIIASVVVSAAGVQLGELWSEAAKMLRLGNDHLGYRAYRIPWRHHLFGLFVTGIVLFC